MKYIIIGICILIIVYSIYIVVKSVIKKIKGKGCNGDCSSCSGCSSKPFINDKKK